MKMASARRSRSACDLWISPRIRTPSPGPGKGCRCTMSLGNPSSMPSLRTSSLNNSRSGSKSLSFMCWGSPPTLWCDLITCALPVEALQQRPPVAFALLPRIRLAGGRGQKPLLRIDTNHPHAHVLRERRHHLIALAEPQESVIHEHADELCADGAV